MLVKTGRLVHAGGWLDRSSISLVPPGSCQTLAGYRDNVLVVHHFGACYAFTQSKTDVRH